MANELIFGKKYEEILRWVMEQTTSNKRCAEILEIKNHMMETSPECQDALLRMDELLSEFYGVQ
jgi:hypothetical protein